MVEQVTKVAIHDRRLPRHRRRRSVRRAAFDRLAKLAPLERLGKPADIAAAVTFLAGPDGGWINGQTLRANGGIVRSCRAPPAPVANWLPGPDSNQRPSG
jgi:NAD(P)-dependent dehydrogenase (short-subunit alcohol dehydrogenase family)